MNFNQQHNQGVHPNPQFQIPLPHQFGVGNSNIAPNISQGPSPFLMMSGVPPGFSGPYPFAPMVDNQQQVDVSSDKSDSVVTPGVLQPNLVNNTTSNFTGPPNQPIPGPYSFHRPMVSQPNIITAAPSVLPQSAIQNLMANQSMLNASVMNQTIINNNIKAPPVMSYPMKPLIDSLLNPVVIKVPEKDETPKLANVVYIGGLTDDTTSEFVINILQKCGKTVHFKRHTDPSSGLLAPFAFCDFESPGGAYYAIECLQDLNYGENKLKVSCNSRVKCQVDDWKEGKIEEMLHKNPDKTREDILKELENYKIKLRNEFIQLINMRFKSIQNNLIPHKGSYDEGFAPNTNLEGESDVNELKSQGNLSGDNEQNLQNKSEVVDGTEDTTSDTFKDKDSKSKNRDYKENKDYLTKEYKVHKKESERIYKLRIKKRNYESKYKEYLPEWLHEEEKMFKKIKMLFEVSSSKRDKLIQDDLDGLSKPNLKYRLYEIEEDEIDEQNEINENKSKKISLKFVTQVPSTSGYDGVGVASGSFSEDVTSTNTSKVTETKQGLKSILNKTKLDETHDLNVSNKNRQKVVTLFSSEVEEEKKPQLTEEQIWEMVPNSNIFDYEIDWDFLFGTNLSILIEPWIRRCILEYMGDEESLVNDVVDFIFSRLKERPKPQELLFDAEQFLDEESQGFITQLWRLLIFHQIRLKSSSGS